MSAEILRRAASLMRERAEAATEGPWFDFAARRGTHHIYGVTTDLDVDYDTDLFTGSSLPDAKHIASWHPAVALAVADWLEIQADLGHGYGSPAHRAALAVARAYLGALA